MDIIRIIRQRMIPNKEPKNERMACNRNIPHLFNTSYKHILDILRQKKSGRTANGTFNLFSLSDCDFILLVYLYIKPPNWTKKSNGRSGQAIPLLVKRIADTFKLA